MTGLAALSQLVRGTRKPWKAVEPRRTAGGGRRAVRERDSKWVAKDRMCIRRRGE